MGVLEWTLLGIFAAAVIAMVVLKSLNVGSKRRGIAKMIASSSFVAMGVCGVVKNPSTLQFVLLLGLIFAFFGDLFLVFMDEHKWFVSGVLSFSLCSLTLSVYIFAMGNYKWWFVVVLVVLLVVNALMQIKGIYDFGRNTAILNVYTAMVALCGSLGFTLFTQGTGDAKMFVSGLGCFLYLVSDICLGLYLYKFRNSKVDVINTLTYFPGMILVAVSALL